VGREEHDPQRFWLTMPGQLRQTSAEAALMQAMTVAPDPYGPTIVELLPKHMPSLQNRLWLVNDDVHELGSAGA
jgi:LuxR family maltose regulon positive regulatory protein